ncbi:MAG: hypothetical protein ACJAVY_001776 [Marinoscillum sp.]|jgi:hypothetical protein
MGLAELSEPNAKKSSDSPKEGISSHGVTVKQDTTEANSVSKFNFVFYFIYKMKYTEDAEGREYVDYGF